MNSTNTLLSLIQNVRLTGHLVTSELETRNQFFFSPVIEPEVISVFRGLNNSKSSDVDGIKMAPAKYVIELIAPCLTYMFNLCFLQGVFPKRLQVARVTVLYKKGDKNNIGNYRPVSILPIFSKGLEKVIYAKILNFCDKYSILSRSQFGFRKHRSMEQALLEQKEFILNAFEKKRSSPGCFCRLHKSV